MSRTRFLHFAKVFGIHFVAWYLTIGLSFGYIFYRSMPALNVAGMTYYAATWPWFVCYASKHCTIAPVIPSWSFTFKQ